VRIPVKYRKLAIVLVSIAAAYAVIGFFVLPPLIKPKLINAIQEATNRSVRVGDLSINPFTLSATVSGFELKDRNDSGASHKTRRS
jgi:hypothetical protein